MNIRALYGITLAGSLLTALVVTAACDQPTRSSEVGHTIEPAVAAAAQTTPAQTTPAQTTPEVQPIRVDPWPTGYVVASEDEWVPVVDDLGRDLVGARVAFAEGDRGRAAAQVRTAVAFLRAENEHASDAQRAEVARTATALELLATRIAATAPPSQADVDRALAQAYGADVRNAYVHLHEEAVQQFVVAPTPHFGRAEAAFERGDEVGAAREIREAAGWFSLVADEATGDDDRDNLREKAASLVTLARHVEDGEVSDVAELHSGFAEINTAYSMYYLHLAEAANESRAWQDVGKHLHAAAQRLEDAARWGGNAAAALDEAMLRDVRATATTLVEGGRVTARDLRQTLEHLRTEVTKLAHHADEHTEH